MKWSQRFFLVVFFGLGSVLTVSESADAQPGRSRGGRASAPAAGPVQGPNVSAVRPSGAVTMQPVTQHVTYNNYHVYPPFGSAAPFGSAGIPMAGYARGAAPLNSVYSYYYGPRYAPLDRGWAGAAYYDLPWWFFAAASDPMFAPRNSEPLSKEATIEILMPRSDADLLVDGAMTTTNGLRRFFTSPELEPGNYTYQLTARWMRADQEIRMERSVQVSPGGHFFVDFNRIELTSESAARD
jgi:uncharacterized protein (TIGR03000 family)